MWIQLLIRITEVEEVATGTISSIIKRNNTGIEMIIKKVVIHNNSNIKTKGLNTSQEAIRNNTREEDSNQVGEITNIAKEEKADRVAMEKTNNTMKRRATSQEITTLTVNNHQRKITDNIIMINKDNNHQKKEVTKIKNNRRNSMVKVRYRIRRKSQIDLLL